MPGDNASEARSMDHQRKLRYRQGFTIIELLVVVGIIAVLAAIAFTAFQAMQRSAAEKRTRTMLANAAAMLAEYGANNALKDQPGFMWTVGGTKYSTAGFDIWNDADPAAAGVNPLKPPSESIDETDLMGVAKTQAVLNTATVIREMKRSPNVEKMLAQLPANSTMMVYEPNTTTAIGPVLLDGWGRPIIFVPSPGLDGVIIGEPTDAANPFRITSVKAYAAGTLPVAPNAAIPGARPFFASAGPDGSFAYADKNTSMAFEATSDGSAGDDNLYSFEK
jgi:prepilin-type N-terminal cleavage/methylation domain-containing protein